MFDRQRQTWQYSIVTDCGGELSRFCQLAAPQCDGLLWGTADVKSVLEIPLGWSGGQWTQMTSA